MHYVTQVSLSQSLPPSPPSVTYPWGRGSGAAGLSVEPSSVSLTSRRVSDSYTRQVPTRSLSLFLVAVRGDWFFTHVVVSSHISHVSVCSTDPMIAGDWLMTRDQDRLVCVHLVFKKQEKHTYDIHFNINILMNHISEVLKLFTD